MSSIFVDREAVKTLKKTNVLIEELLETLDVLADKEALEALDESLKNKKTGRVRSLKSFLADLNA